MKFFYCLVVFFLFCCSSVNFSASSYLNVSDDSHRAKMDNAYVGNKEELEDKKPDSMDSVDTTKDDISTHHSLVTTDDDKSTLHYFLFLQDLFRAAEINDLETLKNILESNKSFLNKRGMIDMTPLRIAAIKGSLDVIKYLVAELHVDIDKLSLYERASALSEAVKAGQLESVKLLLELGANKYILIGADNNTLLHQAALGRDIEVLKYLLPYFNVDVINDIGETPTYLAVSKDKLEALRILIDNGANPYKRHFFNRTLLHAAVESDQVDMVRELIQYKELINAPDEYGNLPIDIISNMQVVKELVDAGANITDKSIWNYLKETNYDVVKYLVAESGKVNLRITWDKRDCRETLLMILLYMDTLQYDMIKFILDRGADVNIKNCMNVTALHRAAYYEKENTLQIIKLLLDKGADINAPDRYGFTPLDYARAEGNYIVYKYLKELGAVTKESTSGMDSLVTTEDDIVTLHSLVSTEDNELSLHSWLFEQDSSIAAAINDLETLKNILESNKHFIFKRNKGGKTLLYIAATEGSLDVIKYLVAEQHVDIDKLSLYEGPSPLSEAVKAGQLESVKLLFDLGAYQYILLGYEDNTLLHQAALGHNIEVLKFLLPYFNVDVTNYFGETPTYLAVRGNKPEAFQVLIDNGADPYKSDHKNKTLLHAAVESGQADMVRELIQYKELINAPDKYGNLPIDIISNMQIVKELVDAGANITDKSIWNYLSTLNYDVVKYLVAESGKVNIRVTWDRRDCRETLLMILLDMDTLPYDMIKFILDRGADVNIKYCMNITALHRAAYYEKENTLQIIKLLLDKGADINAPDVDGLTPLDYARGEGNHIVFKYLKELGAVTKESKGMDSLVKTDILTLHSSITTAEDDKSTLHHLVMTYDR